VRILHEVRLLLKEADFRTAQSTEVDDTIQFENVNLVGEVIEFASVDRLLRFWQERENLFLKQSAARLRLDPQKAWNIYMVFLSADQADSEQQASLLAIEEDFAATRKIARASVSSRIELARAMAPLLPLSATPSDDLGEPEEMLRDKLEPDERVLLQLTLDAKVSDGEIVSWLIDRVK
jgi:hypothetical protein